MLYFGKPFNKKSSLWFLNWQREWGAQLGQKHLIFLQKFLRNEKFLNLGNFPQPWFWNRGWTPTTLLSICLCTANVGGLVVVRYPVGNNDICSHLSSFSCTCWLFLERGVLDSIQLSFPCFLLNFWNENDVFIHLFEACHLMPSLAGPTFQVLKGIAQRVGSQLMCTFFLNKSMLHFWNQFFMFFSHCIILVVKVIHLYITLSRWRI